jgi:lipopolysaccharide biosynthesis glycosyltransferase
MGPRLSGRKFFQIQNGCKKMKIFIGYDSKQHAASCVAEYSLRKHSPHLDLDITHLKKQDLIDSGDYFRIDGDPSSTEFTYTRFLVPHLCNYQGHAMFIDSDFLFTTNVQRLWNLVLNDFGKADRAAYCVKHSEYTPKKDTKFYGKPQITFPKKNWSSLIIFNNEHPQCRQLTPMTVANQTPQWLHRFSWIEDHDTQLGNLPMMWNWLVGEYNELIPPPFALHYTNGGPFNEVYGQDYEQLWLDEFQEMSANDDYKSTI